MRRSILALVVALSSTLSFADIATELQKKNCGLALSNLCRVIVAPKKIEKQGYCVGMFMTSLPCVVSFISVKEGAAMNLTCGTDPKKPVLNQDMAAEAIGYNVATLRRDGEGNDEVINDRNDYSMFSNRMVEVMLTDSIENGVKTTSGTVELTLQMGPVALTNVTCH